MRSHLRSIAASLFLMSAVAAVPGCARNPVTGDLQLALISEAQEIQMGEQAARDVEQSIGLVDDPALQTYVQELGRRLAASSERPHLPWSFAVVDDPTPNAFALPGGYIYITRGLLGLMGTEAQLVSVLGHEIGHVTARHHVSSLSRTQLAQLGLGVGGVLFPDLQAVGGVASASLQLLFLRHGRDAERQADELGFRYTLQSGFDVREMALVFQSLQRMGEQHQQSAVPSWLLTHPEPGDRIQVVQQRVAAAGPLGTLRIGGQPYLERIDGLVYGANPRNGYFRDGVFLHPDLRFRIPFPAQWQTQNMSQAVMGMSPNQDALIQLSLAPDRTIDAAAQRFLSQQGIEPGTTTRTMVNGLNTIQSTFRAQTQDAAIQGMAAFVSHGGAIYQILGYSTLASFPNYENTLRQALRGFAPLTDPQALNVQPSRLRIVRSTESMTLAQFTQRFPSSVSLDELAIINQVPGGNSLLSAGTLLKRITN